MKNIKNTFVLMILLFISDKTYSLEIVDIKRNIPLAESDPVYKDFYIKVSNKSELKKNLVVRAVRKIIVKDVGAKAIGDFKTVVGLVKILEVSDSIAVGREFKLTPRSDEPMLDQIGIMVGDEIDTENSFIDTTKPSEKNHASVLLPDLKKTTESVEQNNVVPTEKTASVVNSEEI